MARYGANSLALAKMESVYGTDSGPTHGANPMLAREVKVGIPSDPIERKLLKPTMGNLARPITRRHASVEIEVELQSSGAAGTPPAWGPLVRACGFAQTITAGVKVEYTPISTAFESATLWFYADGVLHKQPGCRGTMKLVIPKNEIPHAVFTLSGLYVDPSDAGTPTGVDWSAFKAPKAISYVNTPTFTLHGTPSVMRTLEVDIANNVVFRDLVGATDVQITGRDPKGMVSIEAVPTATKDWYAAAKAETLAAMAFQHGSTAGSIIEINAPKAQVISVDYAEEDGILYNDFELNIAENLGNDELVLVCR